MSAHTKGPWRAENSSVIGPDNQIVSCCIRGSVDRGDEEEDYATARLIAEAGTVATETGLTPRQLAEQRAELLEALQNAVGPLELYHAYGWPDRSGVIARARAAITKARGES